MKFKIISHACFSVEAASIRLVVDPWLVGPVYWNAWWHCPEPSYDESIFSVDYMYLTHWHFDHMHQESLELFDRSCHILVPRFPVSTMVEQLSRLGFQNITEMGHGQTVELGPDFHLTSYQVAFQDDSVCVVDADGVAIVNLNDAKPLPRGWKQIKKRFPKLDFMLRSHSPAWSYPSAYTFDDPEEAIPVTRDSYKSAFRNAATILQPRYAVPLASSVCHPHPDILFENDKIISAFELEDFLKAQPLTGTDLAIMPHGSQWSSETGFSVDLASGVSDPVAFVAANESNYRPIFEEAASREAETDLHFETFETFFRDFFGSLLVVIRLFLKIKLVFTVCHEGRKEYWSADFRSGKISRDDHQPAHATSIIEVPPAILEEALKTHVFTNIDISKRWKVHICRGGVTKHLVACVLISFFEAGYLTLGNVFRWRFLSGVIARRAEVMDYLGLCITMIRRDPKAVVDSVTGLD
jgi:UDP-MurNAc hydroxylase